LRKIKGGEVQGNILMGAKRDLRDVRRVHKSTARAGEEESRGAFQTTMLWDVETMHSTKAQNNFVRPCTIGRAKPSWRRGGSAEDSEHENSQWQRGNEPSINVLKRLYEEGGNEFFEC